MESGTGIMQLEFWNENCFYGGFGAPGKCAIIKAWGMQGGDREAGEFVRLGVPMGIREDNHFKGGTGTVEGGAEV